MYKYLNQHIIGVITFDSGAPAHASQAIPKSSIYLVDSVTGAVLYHSSVRTRSPILATMSENWLVWTYPVYDLEFGESESAVFGATKGQHVVSVEFYEGAGVGDKTKRYVCISLGHMRVHCVDV